MNMRIRARHVGYLFIAAVVFFPAIALFAVDWLWFSEVGFFQIFKTVVFFRWVVAATVFVAGIAWVEMNMLFVRRMTGISSHAWDRRIRLLAFAVVLVSALAAGGAWETVLLFVHRQPFGSADPLFGKDIGYYFFTMPFLSRAVGYALWLTAIGAAAAALSYMVRGVISATAVFTQRGKRIQSVSIGKAAAVHASLLSAVWFSILAFHIRAVRIPGLVLSSQGNFFGAGYVERYAILPFLKVLFVLAVVLAVLSLVNIRRRTVRLVGYGIAAYAAVALIGGWAYPAFVQKFVVLPNELNKEAPFLAYHINATRKAFGVDSVAERDITGEDPLTYADIQENAPTVSNIRLWDRDPLLDTFSQVQEIRTYYDFISVDNDRYSINGNYRQVLLSPRELNSRNLPQRNFINERLTFTHGFGAALSPVNEVTPEGLPVLFVKDLPPKSSYPSLRIQRPEIYYGELAEGFVVVKTQAQEFQYPEGEKNVYGRYEGEGGVPVRSLAGKALLAVRLQSLKLLLSEDITNESRVMIYRNIRERVRTLFPFLRFDQDPYLVITPQGRLVWMYDAYTASDRYPYSQPMKDIFRQGVYQPSINYIRNAVKITVDAYDGTVTAYLADSSDPLIQTYARIFPGAFVPLEEMPDGLRAHIRYPEDLFRYQARIFAVYQMNDVQVFYNREDEWQIPFITTRDQTGDTMTRHIIMKLPGEEREEYILMQPFTPRGKENLSAWMAARSDGDAYGQLVVYRFPKQRLVFGPKQIMNRINQDPEISQQISLWDQRGSEVIFGSLLVIPIKEALVYVQPVYLRAEGGRIPELKRVIVAYENRIAMDVGLEGALRKLFEETYKEADSERQAEKNVSLSQKQKKTGEFQEILKRAQRVYEQALQAQQMGNWAQYGSYIKELGDLLRQETQ